MLCRLLSTHNALQSMLLSGSLPARGVAEFSSVLPFLLLYSFFPHCLIPKYKEKRRKKKPIVDREARSALENEIVVVEFLASSLVASFWSGGEATASRLYKARYHEIVEHLNLTLISLNITSRHIRPTRLFFCVWFFYYFFVCDNSSATRATTASNLRRRLKFPPWKWESAKWRFQNGKVEVWFCVELKKLRRRSRKIHTRNI